MTTAQYFVGMVLLIATTIAAFVKGIQDASNVTDERDRVPKGFASFFGVTFSTYVVIGMFLGIIWAIAWFGMTIQNVVEWSAGAVFAPFRWLIGW